MAPESLPEPVAVAIRVADALTRIGIPYVIGGSFASSIHGEPRSTNDVDMVADLSRELIGAFIEALGPDWYVSRQAVAEAVEESGAFNIIHMPTAVKVDIFVPGSDAFDHERLKRRALVSLAAGAESAELFVDTAEHTILRKLEWYRRGGEVSERQWRDVVAIVSAQSSRLDRAYILGWAAQLGVADLAERVLKLQPGRVTRRP